MLKRVNEMRHVDCAETENCSSDGISLSTISEEYRKERKYSIEEQIILEDDELPDFKKIFRSPEDIFGNTKFYTNEFDAFEKYYEAINEDNSILDLVNAADCLPFDEYCELYEYVKITRSEEMQNIEEPCLKKMQQNILYAIPGLKIQESPERGRHLITTTSLDKGEIIINEKATVLQVNPLCYCFRGEHKMYRCHECAYIVSKFYTCNNCNIVVYCSVECLKKSYDEYHRFECEALQRHYWRLDDTQYSYIAFRMVLYGALHSFNYELKEKHKNYYGSELNNYPYIYRLQSHFNKFPLKRIFEILQVSAKTLVYLICRTNFFTQFECENEQILHLHVGGLLVKHYCQAQTNNILLKLPNLEAEYGFNVPSGTGKAICPTVSLLNHSCTPNAVLIPNNNRVLIKTLRSIREGEEITISYQEINTFLSYEDRNTITQELFYFKCDCSFCFYERSWATYPYQCKYCPNGKGNKLTLNNGEEKGFCKMCCRYFIIDHQAERLAQVCAGLYRATYDLDPVLRIAECYDKLYPSNSWMLLDVYRILYDKYYGWGEKPLETIKYGLMFFNILESHIPKLYKPLLEGKLKFFFGVVNSSKFLELKTISETEHNTLKIFHEEILRTKNDILFYVPVQYTKFFSAGLLTKFQQVYYNLIIIEGRQETFEM